jgi:hypothetical protein
MKIREIKTLKDAKKAKRGDPVRVSFFVETGVETGARQISQLVDQGVFYQRKGEDISLVLPIVGADPEIGVKNYAWTGSSYDPRTDNKFPFKKGSRNYRKYGGLLKQMAEAGL